MGGWDEEEVREVADSLLSLVVRRWKKKRSVNERWSECGGLREKRDASGSTRLACCSINRSQHIGGRGKSAN